MSVSISTKIPLRKSQSMPHISSRHDSGVGLSGAGSCSLLDQIGYNALYHHNHRNEKIPYSTRLVADLRQLMTLRQHYYPEGGWGWLLVFVGFTVQCLSHGLNLSVGILTVQIVKEFHQDYLQAGMLGTISVAMGLFFSPITVSLCKRKSTRLIAVIGGLVTALGCLFTSFASQFHQMVFSYGCIVGLGVGITRDCSTIMVAQYFKKRRELVEIFIVSGSGCGIICMSVLLSISIEIFGWRLGLQAITIIVFSTFILGLFYRSASLYHPQRRAILHLKNQRRKVKDKNKKKNHPPFFDFKTLRSKTVRILLVSSALSAFGLYTPIFYLAQSVKMDNLEDKIILLQSYIGISWILGCFIFGLLVVRSSVECRIARQYLCQVSVFMCGLCMLIFSEVGINFEGYVLFVWTYGIFCGGYHYSLKVYTYERVRARNFAYAWGFVQFSQSIPIVLGATVAGLLNKYVSYKSGYVFSFFCTTIGSLILFLVDVHKRNISHHKHTRANGKSHLCITDECPKNRKLSFSQEPDIEPAINFNGACTIPFSDMLGKHLSEDLAESVNGKKPELTCISEEGIADMDLPDNLFDDFGYIGDCITSCNKVENYLILSEFENNLNVNVSTTLENNDKKCHMYTKCNEHNM